MIPVKICGLNDEGAVSAIIEAGAGYAGFVHYPRSPRHVSLKRAASLKKLLPQSVKSVVVVVNPLDDLLEEIVREVNPDFFQLHGEESAQRVAAIRSIFPHTRIIKALPIADSGDVNKVGDYNDPPDFFLFDAKPADKNALRGGNGVAFDWRLLRGETPAEACASGENDNSSGLFRQFPTPWFLSGGLNAGNVSQAIKLSGAKFIDVSSGVETSPGVKDAGLINQFVKAVRKCC